MLKSLLAGAALAAALAAASTGAAQAPSGRHAAAGDHADAGGAALPVHAAGRAGLDRASGSRRARCMSTAPISSPPRRRGRPPCRRLDVPDPAAGRHAHARAGRAGGGERSDAPRQPPAGIYYALNPNNIRRATPGAPFGPDQVEALYAGGGITGPGGHPRPLYEMLARLAQQRGFEHGAAARPRLSRGLQCAEARAAVDRVRAAGSRRGKLYLLDHAPRTARDSARACSAPPSPMRGSAGCGRSSISRRRATSGSPSGHAGVAAIVHMPGAVPRGEADAPYQLSAEDAALARAQQCQRRGRRPR